MTLIDIFSFFFPLFGKTDRAAVLDYNVYNPTSLKIKEQRCSLLSTLYSELAVIEILFIEFIPKDIYLVLN